MTRSLLTSRHRSTAIIPAWALALASLAPLHAASPAFYHAPPRDFPAGSNTVSVAVGHFNADAALDAATANRGDNTVSVLLGTGDGRFHPPVNYSAGVTPKVVVAFDFDKDGKLDLLTAGTAASSNFVAFLKGNGDGTFRSPLLSPAGDGLGAIAVGDFNGDGTLDVVVAENAGYTILLGQGNGTFVAGSPVFLARGTPLGFAVTDFNHDGKTDILAQCDGPVVLLGNGDGTFAPASATLFFVGMNWVGTGDFDGDHNADIVAFRPHGGLAVWLGKGDGTFHALKFSPLYSEQLDRALIAVLGDFTNDGIPDVGLSLGFRENSFATTDSVVIAIGQGDGTFRPGKPAGVDHSSSADPVTAGDFNGDGTLDLVSANGVSNDISLLLGNGDGSFRAPPSFLVEADGARRGMVAADFNGDGQADVAVASGKTNSIYVLLAKPSGGGFLPAVHYDVAGAPAFPFVIPGAGDLNGDGRPDLIQGSSVLLNNGDCTFRAGMPIAAVGSSVIADLNGDGKADVITQRNDRAIVWLRGNGDGTFQAPAVIASPGRFVSIVTGDLNQDGKIDLLLNPSPGKVGVLLGKGDGTLQPMTVYSVGGTDVFLTVADINRDGHPDVVFSGAYLGELFGKGDGTLKAPTGLGLAIGSTPIVADTNNDGNPDLVFTHFANSAAVKLGNGDGTFGPPIHYPAGVNASAALVADVTGDGKPDIVTTGSEPRGSVLGLLINITP
jgi:hypothetical protein